jgi:hypothetical protein
MKYIELFEGKDAPLFHGTSIRSANLIVKKDIIKSLTKHKIGDKIISGVSTSRNFNYSYIWSVMGVVFQLNQRLLSHNYKIIPVDVFNQGFPKRRFELEEFIVGDIFPLSKYLEKIIIGKNTISKLKRFNVLSKHPLLTVLDLDPLKHNFPT